MAFNVSSLEFWKDRISTALQKGKIHHSIYEIDDSLWKAIEYRHMTLINMNIQATDMVLDIGCGYGRLSRYFQSENYTGVDFSEDFLDLAKEINPSHKYIKADLKELPFEDNQFDWGIGVSIKWMVQRELGAEIWEEMEKELKRVCKNLIFLEYSDGKDHYLIEDHEVILCED
jgi:ubiquinone/menaquinone biosynthesis C-methylase UbiE